MWGLEKTQVVRGQDRSAKGQSLAAQSLSSSTQLTRQPVGLSVAMAYSADHSRSEIFQFLDLPFELRTMIYDYSLLTSVTINTRGSYFGREAVPYFTDFTPSTKKPTIGLLRVSKQIREEASSIFYGKNLFDLPCDPEHPTSLAAWDKHRARLRFVMVRFESYPVSTKYAGCLRPPLPPYHLSRIRPIEENEKFVLKHNALVDDLLHKWEKQLCIVKNMKVKTLVLNMRDCWCSQFCCRLPKKVCTSFLKRYILPKGSQAKTHEQSTLLADIQMKIIGIVTDEEAFMQNMGILDVDPGRKKARTKCAPIGRFPNG